MIVGIVLHIVAASRRRRMDETLSVIPRDPHIGSRSLTIDGDCVR
jgi:hypothetical protein